MRKTFPTIELRHGVFHIHARPCLLISADYPYYRDEAANWKERLASLKSLGIAVVTAYIPWRHHQTDPDMAPDFSGVSAPNRDVLGFLRLCAEFDLMVIVKPGPFIHAEVNYGGLPDWVCSINNPHIESLLNAEGEPQQWSGSRLAADGKSIEPWPLPAPFSPEFLRLSRTWLGYVGREVIRPYQAPAGPIVAVQIGNEGIYSNGQHAPWAYDYSPSALAKFASFLEQKYQTLENYNELHGTQFNAWKEVPAPRQAVFPLTSRQARMLEDWGAFQAWYMDAIFREWSEPLSTNLPVIINQNPPLETYFGLDAWLTRVEPERWQSVHYGFTNWLGDVSANPSAFDRYLLTAKRFPGPNMEENWGFAKLYGPAYVDASTSFYQTLSILNNGATGFNIYTGVGTAHADPNLEIIQKVPYPDAAPITAEGALTPKAEIVRWLVTFFERHGADFLACQSAQPVAWGLYLPHARVAVWSPENDQRAPRHGEHLKAFQEQMRHLRVDYAVVNLETVSPEDLRNYEFVFLAGGERMDARVQQKLADYARSGGKLIFLERIPLLDENGSPCETLQEIGGILHAMLSKGYAELLSNLPRPFIYDGDADIWVRSHPERDLHFVTILIPAHGKSRVEATLEIGKRRQHLLLSAVPSGGALLRIENGQITDAILKGHNAYLGQSVTPQCRLDAQTIGLDEPGDIFLFDGSISRLLSRNTYRKGPTVKHRLFQALRASFMALLPLLIACNASPVVAPTRSIPNPTLPANTIEVWLTLGDKSKLLSNEPDLTFTPGSPVSGKTIQIDASTLYQQFEGAGAAMTDSSAWLIMHKLDATARRELMRNLFTREGNGIGLSYLRLPMGASDFALQDYTYDDLPAGETDPNLEHFSIAHDQAHIIPVLKLALDLNPHLGLLASPWSAPAWMKKNNQLHGSSLLPEFYQAFADYHVRFVQAYAAEGITIHAVTPQNEPLHATDDYPSMYMSAKDQQRFVRDYLGPAFRAAGLKTKILIYDHNWNRVDYPLTVLSDPAAAAFVDGVAFHCYGGDVSAQSRVHQQYPDKGIWFTECSGGRWATDFSDNLSWNVRHLVIGNFRNWGKSLLLWNLALDENDGPQNGGCGNCRGVVTIHQTSGQVTYNEEYYVLGHVTKFIDPGAYYIESSAGVGIPNNVAFLNPDGSIVVIVQADSTVDFNIAWNGKFFPYHLPGGGVVTFKWNASVPPVATATSVAAPTSTLRPTTKRGTPPASGVLLDFENNPSIFASQNARAMLGHIAHSGKVSLQSASSSGHWHIVGVDFPYALDLSGFAKLCFWVYDTTAGDNGNANNTIGVKLTDASGASQEVWSDHAAAGSNPRTVRNAWVQMCIHLSAYTIVDLSSVTAIEFETYWAGEVYFDDISVESSNR